MGSKHRKIDPAVKAQVADTDRLDLGGVAGEHPFEGRGVRVEVDEHQVPPAFDPNREQRQGLALERAIPYPLPSQIVLSQVRRRP